MTERKTRHQPPRGRIRNLSRSVWRRKTVLIAILAVLAIAMHLVLRFAFDAAANIHQLPLYLVLGLGGLPLVYELLGKLFRREFGSDLLAGISIVTSVLLGEYLAPRAKTPV